MQEVPPCYDWQKQPLSKQCEGGGIADWPTWWEMCLSLQLLTASQGKPHCCCCCWHAHTKLVPAGCSASTTPITAVQISPSAIRKTRVCCTTLQQISQAICRGVSTALPCAQQIPQCQVAPCAAVAGRRRAVLTVQLRWWVVREPSSRQLCWQQPLHTAQTGVPAPAQIKIKIFKIICFSMLCVRCFCWRLHVCRVMLYGLADKRQHLLQHHLSYVQKQLLQCCRCCYHSSSRVNMVPEPTCNYPSS